MASILNFARTSPPAPSDTAALAGFLRAFSIEVMPRTAEKVADFRAILPAGTRVYVAHVDGTAFPDMVRTARRLVDEGFQAMPHFPARGIAHATELERMIGAYADAGVRQALVIAGGIARPRGAFHSSMQLLETGLFDAHGFERLHVAGHPEGNRDIDPQGDAQVTAALAWKNAFQSRTDAAMAIATQFAFDARPIIAWADRLRAAGITLPVRVGIPGPARLQTMIRFAMTCGVGPSLRVLQRRAADLTQLMLPFDPTEILTALARHKAAHPDTSIEAAHFFPLGGIGATTDYIADQGPARRRAIA